MFSRMSLQVMDSVADDALANCRTVALLNLRCAGWSLYSRLMDSMTGYVRAEVSK